MEEGVNDTVNIGPWRAFDPHDADWVCLKCNALKANGGSKCCGKDRIFNEEELKQLADAEHTGELVYEEVILTESADPDLPDWVECARQWSASVVQTLRIGGRLFVLIAVRGPDACVGTDANIQRNGMEMILGRCKPNPRTYTFPTPRCLDSISKEVIKQRFNIDWTSGALQLQPAQQHK